VVLSQSQRAIYEKARALGAGAQGVALDDGACRALLAIATRDLGLGNLLGPPSKQPELLSAEAIESLTLDGAPPLSLYTKLVEAVQDADTYFASLAALHKARLKFRLILETQRPPTIDQVGPRGLLESGVLPTAQLVALLFWRKWIYDIDNRAAQGTGYLFQPIVAGAIGGTPASDRNSPVRRRSGKGRRQVDCVRGNQAYELKLRVTIAASGQGRWQEELDFPLDCKDSGMQPVLVVLDPTDDPKLRQLCAAYKSAGGEYYVGDEAWKHLEQLAGPTMAKFLEKYVRAPLREFLSKAPADESVAEWMPPLQLSMNGEEVRFSIDGKDYVIKRRPDAPSPSSESPDELIPPDVDELSPGP
jgi:hypothetical protein